MIHTRREMISRAGMGMVAAGAIGHLSPSPSIAAASGMARTPTLIVVYLRGGADSLSVVVPYRDKDYRRHRPSLALDSGSSSTSVLPLNEDFGFNPNLKELHALYESGLCVPIVAVGSPDTTRSHFDAQDFMERGAPGLKNVNTGWLNRYLDETRTSHDANLRSVALQPLLPRSLRGSYPVLARPEQNADQAMAMYAQLYRQPIGKSARTAGGSVETRSEVQAFGARTIEQLWELSAILEQPSPVGVEYPETAFGRALRDIAKLIKAQRGLEVTGLDYGGWDHHVDEGPVTGQMGKNLADVSASIGALAQDIGPELLQSTLVLVMSEFGRTVKENDNQGTDHGHGGFMLAIGGKVKGGQVYGKWTGLDDQQLYQGRDVPVHTDFRAVFAESLQCLYDVDPFRLKLFPGYEGDSHASQALNFLQRGV